MPRLCACPAIRASLTRIACELLAVRSPYPSDASASKSRQNPGRVSRICRSASRRANRADCDDAWNFLPARITALLMCLCAFPLGLDGRGAFRVVMRDHRNHLSPNCAWPESAAAGALGVQLGGTHAYFGKTVVKPTIGDDTRPPEPEDIQRLNRLMFAAAGLTLAVIVGIGAMAG